MEKQRLMILFTIILSAVMLTNLLMMSTQATTTNDSATKKLPDFIEGSIALMYPNATDSKLAEIRALWAEQLSLKETRIVETKGAVLNVQPVMDRGTSCIASIVKEEPMYGGQLIDAYKTIGVEDQLYARFYTPGSGQGSGLSAKLTGTNAAGDVYVCAKLGPTGAGKTGNYMIVWGGNSTVDWNWVPIGYAQITSSSAAYYYVGSVGSGRAYNYTSIGTNTMMNPNDYNDVMVDWVWFKDY